MDRRGRRTRSGLGKLRKGLLFERDDGDGMPGASGGVEHQEGESAVSGDET